MADDDQTQFRFDFGGIRLELSGKRPFVERMYRRVMEDVEEARRRARRKTQPEAPKKAVDPKPSVWVHRCSDMMRKIYMVSRGDLAQTPLGDVLDVEAMANIYVEKKLFEQFFPDVEGGQTLWAEFTAVGRKKIAEATRPKKKALDLSDLKSKLKSKSKSKSKSDSKPKKKSK